MHENILLKLRGMSIEERIGPLTKKSDYKVLEEWKRSGVLFVAMNGQLTKTYYTALHKLMDCIVPTKKGLLVLQEGGAYSGCWMESTGTINSELLSRFLPTISEETYRLFSHYQKEDGQLPYKVTMDRPSFRQIQMVTPLARCVWNHYELNGRKLDFLKEMYSAMARYDVWLEKYRNTRGTGCVEAFCTFDTGHDLSPRFWHIPDTPHMDDAKQYNQDSPILPFISPDLTANVYCQRLYLARMAARLGEHEATVVWETKAEQSMKSLFLQCYDETDAFFYDQDRNGELVRVQSDVLLRVLACEVGDRDFFDRALRQYLLNTSKFFAKYPFTSISMDDPRFDPFSDYNTWGGTSNFLSLIRTPHAFEHHHRYVELTWVLNPIITALAKFTRFAQTISPWTGKEGFTETYSPAILCLIDFVERLCGIMPRPDGELWFTALLPYPQDHGETIAAETGYSRIVESQTFEFVSSRSGGTVYRNRERFMRIPYGTRAVTDRSGHLQSIIGLSPRTIEGTIWYENEEVPIIVKGNERVEWMEGQLFSVYDPGIIYPSYR